MGVRVSEQQAQRFRLLAERERARADRAAGIVARLQADLEREAIDPRLRSILTGSLRLHRDVELRHRNVSGLYAALAETRAAGAGLSGPAVLAAVGQLAGARGAVVSVPVAGGADAVIASDPRARAAHEAEFCLGEGPAHDCVRLGPLTVRADEMGERWPAYAAAVQPLGIVSVSAVPLRATSRPASLVVHDAAVDRGELARLGLVADALQHVALARLSSGSLGVHDFDHRPRLHQAAGMVAADVGCPVADALVLLRAHAFADEARLEDVVSQVLAGRPLS